MGRMKFAAMFLVFVVFGSAALFAEESGFRVRVEVAADFVQFLHQDIRTDFFIEEAEMPRENSLFFMRNPNFNDTEFDMRYTDPDGRFGAKIGFRFENLMNNNLPLIEDVTAWGRIGPHFRGQIGRFTARVVEKIGGDRDLGVMLFGIGEGFGGHPDLVITSSDSLGLGSNVIGFMPTGIIPLGHLGEVQISGFFAPNEYWLGRRVADGSGQTGDIGDTIVPAYSTYNFGGSLKYTMPQLLTVGMAYRINRTQAGLGTLDLGTVYHNFGLYGIVEIDRLQIGVGYSGHLSYRATVDSDDEIRKPLKNAVHLDINFTDIIPGLTVGLFNNVSFHTLAAEDTFAAQYVPIHLLDDERGFVLYNELHIEYVFTQTLRGTLMVRNYFATIKNMGGAREHDFGRHTFIVEGLARYNITDNVQLRGGLKFEMNTYGTPLSSQVLQNDRYAFSIPVGIVVSW